MTDGELVPVRDYGHWQTMQLIDIMQKCFSNFSSCERMQHGHKMAVFGELIHYYQYTISKP
jgi:hypothetical protein